MDNTEKHFRKPRVLSLCTGYGGLDKGLEMAVGGIQPVAYVEIEAFQCANLVAKMEKGLLAPAPVWTNLKTFPAEQFRGCVDIITGGYPCQPFSNAGQRKGKEDPRHLWPYIREIIRATRPICCFLENVEGHLSLGFREVQASLHRLGYAVEAGIFSASEICASHSRKRLFILAYNENIGCRWRINSDRDKRWNVQESTQRIKSVVWREAEGCSGSLREKELAYCNNRLRVKSKQEIFTRWNAAGVGSFPARPGEQQFPWEPPRQTEPALGGNSYGASIGVDLSRLSGLSNPELEEIYEWMERATNRTDEVRSNGNGVVPQAAQKAFRVLSEKLQLEFN